MLIELDPVDRITADAVGVPGDRTFYLQARKGDQIVTLLMEKQQVQLLAASVVDILSRIGMESGEVAPDEQMGLEEPIEPEFRAGRLEIAYHQDRDLLRLDVAEVEPDEDEEDDDEDSDEEDGDLEAVVAEELTVAGLELGELEELEALVGAGGEDDVERQPDARFWATREQMLSLARHGASVCAAGRPLCQLCGRPIGPEGHVCPALNGHAHSDDG